MSLHSTIINSHRLEWSFVDERTYVVIESQLEYGLLQKYGYHIGNSKEYGFDKIISPLNELVGEKTKGIYYIGDAWKLKIHDFLYLYPSLRRLL